jgi:hypothetical protein
MTTMLFYVSSETAVSSDSEYSSPYLAIVRVFHEIWAQFPEKYQLEIGLVLAPN